MTSQRIILSVFAHPDDESFLIAGIACKHAADIRLILATATLGEEGKVGDPALCTRDELPGVRERELRTAVDLLGIRSLHLLGYRDKALAAAPREEIREKLVRIVRSDRPDIIITFDPNGSNLHEDHIAISRFTSDAVAAAADPRWYPDAGEAHQVRRLLWTPPMAVWEVGRLPDPALQPGIDFLIDIRPWLQRKVEALRAHRTQHLAIERVFFNQPDVDRLLSLETFRQAFGPPLRRRPVDDLFEGLD